MLKNEKQIFPLKKGSDIALYGPGATHMIKGGTGSGDVNEREVVNIYRGLTNAGYHVTSKEWIDQYDKIYTDARTAWRDNILEKRLLTSMVWQILHRRMNPQAFV